MFESGTPVHESLSTSCATEAWFFFGKFVNPRGEVAALPALLLLTLPHFHTVFSKQIMTPPLGNRVDFLQVGSVLFSFLVLRFTDQYDNTSPTATQNYANEDMS